jgi:hypothetical protein
MLDHDLPKGSTTLKMPVGFFGLGEREYPVDHWVQTMQRNRPVQETEKRCRFLVCQIEPHAGK